MADVVSVGPRDELRDYLCGEEIVGKKLLYLGRHYADNLAVIVDDALVVVGKSLVSRKRSGAVLRTSP